MIISQQKNRDSVSHIYILCPFVASETFSTSETYKGIKQRGQNLYACRLKYQCEDIDCITIAMHLVLFLI